VLRRHSYARLTNPHSSANEPACSIRLRNAKIFAAAALSTARSAQEKNFSSTCSGVNGTCGVPLALDGATISEHDGHARRALLQDVGELRIDRDGNFAGQRLHGWVMDGLLGEGLEHGRSVKRGVGGHVRHAELRALDRGRIRRADAGGGEFGDARLDGGDVCDIEVAPQFEGCIDGGVAEAAARVALGLEAALDDVVAPAELRNRLERHLDAAIEGAEIT